jgi:hypothetical protein
MSLSGDEFTPVCLRDAFLRYPAIPHRKLVGAGVLS